jgi:hypothetical protein
MDETVSRGFSTTDVGLNRPVLSDEDGESVGENEASQHATVRGNAGYHAPRLGACGTRRQLSGLPANACLTRCGNLSKGGGIGLGGEGGKPTHVPRMRLFSGTLSGER